MTSTTSYCGRFAPTPSGPLHFGSLVTTMGSYLQARQAGGQWLVRMEDLDPPREQAGAADAIIRTLRNFGFEWDGPVLYQSTQHPLYEAALDTLRAAGHTYACACTRKDILRTARKTSAGYVYAGTCRNKGLPFSPGHAIRLKVGAAAQDAFNDAVQGPQAQDITDEVGDFVLKRRDGLYAYQLAVVCDDDAQGVNEVVRGADLLDNTSRQRLLQRLLCYSRPHYVHLPLALNAAGDKLSKQTFASALDDKAPLPALAAAWRFLGQKPLAKTLRVSSPEAFWKLAIQAWDLGRVPASQNEFNIDNIYL